MKVILIGYLGSQHIVPASKYLTSKYLPDFDIEYLNYKGELNGWSSWLSDHLKKLNVQLVVFALDDYLLSNPIDKEKYELAIEQLKEPDIVCVKLCPNTPGEHEEYPVTTQYTIWNREYLIWLLNQTTNPWDFEINGSAILRNSGKKSVLVPCLDYPTHSCLSERWQGVRLDGVSAEDLNTLKELIK